jgi:Ankyrin repeats (3 copies)
VVQCGKSNSARREDADERFSRHDVTREFFGLWKGLDKLIASKPAHPILERLLALLPNHPSKGWQIDTDRVGADPGWVDEFGSTPFLLACESGDIESVRVLLSSTHGPRLIECHGAQALTVGLVQSDEMLAELRKYGCANTSVEYLVLEACRSGVGAKELIETVGSDDATKAALINAAGFSKDFISVFSSAPTGGLQAPVLDPALPSNRPLTIGLTPPFVMAAARGHTALVEWFLSIPGVDPNLSDHMGDTALIKACEWNHLDIVSMLLRHPLVKIDKMNQLGMTALRTAWDNGSDDCINAFPACLHLDDHQFGFEGYDCCDWDEYCFFDIWIDLWQLPQPICTDDYCTDFIYMERLKMVSILGFNYHGFDPSFYSEDGCPVTLEGDDSPVSPPSDPHVSKQPRRPRNRPVRPVMEAQGGHPAFHRGPAMVRRMTAKALQVRRREQKKINYRRHLEKGSDK